MFQSLRRRSVVGATSVVLGTLYVIGASVSSVAATTPVSTHATVQRQASGAVKVTLAGTWAWKRTTCDAATAAGFAVAWNDKRDLGLAVGSAHVGSPQDAVVHSNSGAPCGAASGNYLTGYFGPLSHTYASAADVPSKICPVSYALTGNRSPLVNAVRTNSLERPGSAPTVGCVLVSVPKPAVTRKGVSAPHAAAHPAVLISGCHGGGPQIECNGSMEGDLKVNPNDPLFAGYHFELSDTSAPTVVTFQNAHVTYNYICPDNSTGSFDVPLAVTQYTVPAGTTGDYPPGGQSDPAVNQTQNFSAPNVCGGKQYSVNAQSGAATFEALLQIDRPGVHLSHFQFHYGDHGGTSWSADAQWFPAPASYSCSAGTPTSPTTATLTGTTTDASVDSAVFNLSPNNGNVAVGHNAGTWTGSATGLTPDTTYTYTVTFKSGGATVGTGSGASCSFHTPQQPTYNCSAGTATSPTTATLTGTTTDATVDSASFNLTPNNGTVTVSHNGGTWTGSATGLTPNTDYTYTVTFKSGNASVGSGSGATCGFHTPQQPTYSCSAGTATSPTTATLVGATSDANVDAAVFNLTPNTGSVTVSHNGGNWTGSATGLTPNTDYTYTVTFKHGANTVGTGSGALCGFHTPQQPTYTCTAAQPLSPNSALIGGTTNDANVNGASAALHPVGGNDTTIVLAGSNGSFSATAGGLQPDTKYVYSVNFTNNGNLVHASTNGGCSFTTPGIVTPTYKCDAPTFLSPSEAILVGETTDTAVSAATFSVNNGAPANGTKSTTNTGVYTFDQTGLQPGTHYSYTVTFNSTPAQSATCQFETPSVSYQCLPTTNLTTDSATVNASTTDNRVTAVNFDLTPGGTVTGNETSSGFWSGDATGLTPDTSYSYVADFLNAGQTLGTANCSFHTPSSPPPHITIEVNKVNDANGDGTYTKDEQAPAPKADVPFQVTVHNTSAVPVILTDITDQWPGQSPFSIDCNQQFVGLVLQPDGQAGDSATCVFTLTGYAPNVGAIVNTAIVHACQVDSNGNAIPTNCDVLPSTSRVTVTQVLPLKIVRPTTTLPFTGMPFGLAPTVLISVLLIGSGVLMIAWPAIARASRRVTGAQA